MRAKLESFNKLTRTLSVTLTKKQNDIYNSHMKFYLDSKQKNAPTDTNNKLKYEVARGRPLQSNQPSDFNGNQHHWPSTCLLKWTSKNWTEQYKESKLQKNRVRSCDCLTTIIYLGIQQNDCNSLVHNSKWEKNQFSSHTCTYGKSYIWSFQHTPFFWKMRIGSSWNLKI